MVTLQLTEREARIVRKALQRVEPMLFVSAAREAPRTHIEVVTLMQRIDRALATGAEVREALDLASEDAP